MRVVGIFGGYKLLWGSCGIMGGVEGLWGVMRVYEWLCGILKGFRRL